MTDLDTIAPVPPSDRNNSDTSATDTSGTGISSTGISSPGISTIGASTMSRILRQQLVALFERLFKPTKIPDVSVLTAGEHPVVIITQSNSVII